MENEKTEMETVKEECKLCGAEGVRTTFKYPAGLVQDIFNCSNLDCGAHKEAEPESEVKLTCPLCTAQIEHLCTYVNRAAIITPNKKDKCGFDIDEEDGNDCSDLGSVYCPECGGNISEGDILEALKLCGYEVD